MGRLPPEILRTLDNRALGFLFDINDLQGSKGLPK